MSSSLAGRATPTADRSGDGESALAVQPFVRRHVWSLAFGVLAVVAFAVLFYAGRHGTFYSDEWYFIGLEGVGSFEDWMRPWVSHWSMVPMILWRSVFAVFGLGTYLPYLALLLVLHLLAAAGLFTLVRRSSGGFVALCAGAVFLFLGSAYQNLFWAFQYGFVASTAAGLWALVAFERGDRRGSAVGAILLLVSLASSGMGVPFAVAAGVELLADRGRRRQVLWLIPVGVAFMAWYLVFARDAVAEAGAKTGRADLPTILSFIGLGPATSIHAIVGLGMLGEVLLYLAGLVTFASLAIRRSVPARAVGAAAGIAIMLAMIAIGRGIFGLGTVSQPRYIYEGVAFLLLIGSALLGRRVATRPTTPTAAILATAVVVLTAIGLLRNLMIIPGGAAVFVEHAGELRAVIDMTERVGADRLDAPIAPGDRAFIPSPTELQAFMAAHGRLDSDVLRSSVVLRPTAEQRDRAMWRVLGATVTPVPGPAPTGAVPPVLLRAEGVSVEGGCLDIRPGGSIIVELGEGDPVALQGSGWWAVGFGHEAEPQETSSLSAKLGDGWYRVVVPDIDDGLPYRLSLRPTGKVARVCSV